MCDASARAILRLLKECGDESDDELLLSSRESYGLLESSLQASDGTWALGESHGFKSEHLFDGHTERFRHGRKDI
jgi:hypothetical protein